MLGEASTGMSILSGYLSNLMAFLFVELLIFLYCWGSMSFLANHGKIHGITICCAS